MSSFVQKRSLADDVAARLQQQISIGQFKVGERLPTEPELMKNYGVGRSTIREAIKILSNLGLVNVQQGVGTFVQNLVSTAEPIDQRLKRASMQDLDEVRQVLEMKIAEKAALKRTEQDIANIRAFLTERNNAANAGCLEECISADINFHTAIAEASKNDILIDLYRSVANHVRKLFTQLYAGTESFIRTQHLHEQLLKHIIAGDSKKAWDTAAKIINHG